jgi:hypothetical protein
VKDLFAPASVSASRVTRESTPLTQLRVGLGCASPTPIDLGWFVIAMLLARVSAANRLYKAVIDTGIRV